MKIHYVGLGSGLRLEKELLSFFIANIAINHALPKNYTVFKKRKRGVELFAITLSSVNRF